MFFIAQLLEPITRDWVSTVLDSKSNLRHLKTNSIQMSGPSMDSRSDIPTLMIRIALWSLHPNQASGEIPQL